jgi:hypothetical protein
MTARYKYKLEEDSIYNVVKLFIDSWKVEEYLLAVDFFTNVCDNLDSGPKLIHASHTQETRRDMVISKFYFAGGSSRFMFQFSTEQVR